VDDDPRESAAPLRAAREKLRIVPIAKPLSPTIWKSIRRRIRQADRFRNRCLRRLRRPIDFGIDASVDFDTPIDFGIDASVEFDTPTDSEIDAPVEFDAATDSGIDASVEFDARSIPESPPPSSSTPDRFWNRRLRRVRRLIDSEIAASSAPAISRSAPASLRRPTSPREYPSMRIQTRRYP
jgi:hypothetical protein